MGRKPCRISLKRHERHLLRRLVEKYKDSSKRDEIWQAKVAEAVLLMSSGLQSNLIAAKLKKSKQALSSWRIQFMRCRTEFITRLRNRGGRPQKGRARLVVLALLRNNVPPVAEESWSVAGLEAELRFEKNDENITSRRTIYRILQNERLRQSGIGPSGSKL